MANIKSAQKRVRKSEKKRVHNRFYKVTTRNAMKQLRNTTDKEEAQKLYPQVVSMLDRLVRRNIIHKNKAANYKSKLAKHVNSLS